MARLLLATALLSIVSAHPVAASSEETAAVADEAGVSQTDLAGAMSSTGLPARTYLEGVGELARPVPPSSARAECIIRVESRGNPNARNPQSGAAGLGQFLASTWRTTPQGRAGMSVYDAAANRAAVNWMLQVGRAREFVAVSGGWC
jgi:soluble lytic murein transglycosylase-like protein